MKENTCQPKILYPVEICQDKGTIRTFLGKYEFATRTPALRKTIKGILKAEGKDQKMKMKIRDTERNGKQ